MTDSDPMTWLAETMRDLGRDALLPSSEDVEDSVWVMEDDAPTGVAGYFVKRRLPLKHRIVRDGRTVAFDFWKDGTHYRIRSGKQSTSAKNLDAICDVLKTLFRWIEDSIVTWDEAFAGFAQSNTNGNEWWRVLRVAPDATRPEVDKAFRRLVRDAHPDRGGTNDAFVRLREAYEQACMIIAER